MTNETAEMVQVEGEQAFDAEVARRIAAAPPGTYAPRPGPGTVPRDDEYPRFYVGGKGRPYATVEEAMRSGPGVITIMTPTVTRNILPEDLSDAAREILRGEARL
jgi:hypothetical protein